MTEKKTSGMKVMCRVIFGDGADYVLRDETQLYYIGGECLAKDMLKHGYSVDGLTLVRRKNGTPYVRVKDSADIQTTHAVCFTFAPMQLSGESRKNFYKSGEFINLRERMLAKYGRRKGFKEIRIFLDDRFK